MGDCSLAVRLRQPGVLDNLGVCNLTSWLECSTKMGPSDCNPPGEPGFRHMEEDEKAETSGSHRVHENKLV